MKKLKSVLVIAVFAVCVAACSSTKNSTGTTSPDTNTQNPSTGTGTTTPNTGSGTTGSTTDSTQRK